MSAPVALRRSLALRFALAALVPLLAVAALVLRHLAFESVDEISERNLLLARAVRGQVEGVLREPVVVLQGLREMLAGDAPAPGEGVQRLLDAAVRGAPLLESISLVGADGRVGAVGVGPAADGRRGDLVGISLAHQPFVRQALATGRPAWSGTYLSLLSGRIALSVCVPLEGGRVLLASLNVERLLEFTSRLSEGDVVISIVDGGGSVVAHPDPQFALRQIKVGHLEPVRRGFAGEEVTVRGEFLSADVFSSVARIGGPGWLVVVSLDAGAALHETRLAGLTFFGALLATTGLAVLFALTQSRNIAAPLATLAEQARNVAAGGYGFAPPRSGTREVQTLAESFAQMAEAVRERERLLRESEEKYRLLVENAGDAVFVASDGRLSFANRRAVELSGATREALLDARWKDLVHPEDRERLLAYDRALLAGEAVPQTVTFRVVRVDGQERWAQMSSVRISWEGRPATLNFLRDITELKTLEAQALQAQKMEAVGTLAGGVAHDFNNLLQAIQASAELALLPGRDPAANRTLLTQIVRATERGADLTRQLLTFSRRLESRRRPVDLNAEIRLVVAMLEHALPKMIRIEVDLAPALPAVSADAGQMQQLLMNLAVNAGHAMRGEGLLRIATGACELSAPDGARPEVLPGRYASVAVSDTGAGIADDLRGRIFEPFFTTKGPGEGTGLGLAMAFGIVKAHEGHIWFDSAVGRGTTFTVLLPALATAAAAVREAAAVPSPAPAGAGGCILIVDDEAVVRDVGAALLESHGYRVLRAGDGESALRIFRERPREIDLVLLDMIMPGMGGRRCLAELLTVDPAARVLVASGFPGRDSGGEGPLPGALGFVDKPFRLRVLLDAVGAALAQARPRRA